jgi:sulfoxide reductase catalytic subunit YedY
MSLRDALRIPTAEITDESVYRDRRRLLAAFAASPALALAGCSDAAPPPPTRTVVTPAEAASGFRTDETLTRFADVTTYNNFYEFGSGKADPSRAQKTLRTQPWHVLVDGECAKPGRLSLDDLLKGFTPEERIYRLRCVEGWSMVIPWLGVPLGPVLKRFEPTSKAKYVAFVTLGDPAQMPGIRAPILEWPYREGLRIDEALHPLAFLATGLYGKPLPQQNGAPLRLLVPWKYGFKGIKSIVRIAFVERMPETAWHTSQPGEYGFFSNVNPNVDHPRWSQARERRLPSFIPNHKTEMFNGYTEQVAYMYKDMDLRKSF